MFSYKLYSCCGLYVGPMTVGYEVEVYTAQGMVELSISVTNPPTGGALRPFALVVNTADSTASIVSSFTAIIIFMTYFFRSK